MAKVSLRIYNREIEGLVDSGQLDEAIAHCRHILNDFPKHLETYRMIGKAYLEAKRYNEATDIFERVLMAVPDDFVAHVGMSIIRDEQKMMDAAIWHMQRAFEVQPSNTAIQAELQRLYGRRDGIEPPKIRLTRGALAHMYLQGELYPQAISEINAVLEEDPERQDMQVLLARAYFHAGQKSEAAEMCSQLLRRYPYCFDANRVLVELLPQTDQGESVQTYRKRINELDPYIAFATGSVFHTEEVPDAAVSLERLEWDGQPIEMGPEWSESKGIGLGEPVVPVADETPDWLRDGLEAETFGAPTPTDELASAFNNIPVSTPSTGDEDGIPDFLRAAGWGEDTGTFQEGLGSLDDSEESSEDLPLAQGDLPDWIKAMAPAGADVSPQQEAENDLSQDDVPNWLQGLGDLPDKSSEGQPPSETEMPDWLGSMENETPESRPEEPSMAQATGDDNIPDWLGSLESAQEEAPELQPQEPAMPQPAGDEDVPDWLGSMDSGQDETPELQPEEPAMAQPTGGEDVPDWLGSLESEQGETPEPQPEESSMVLPTGDEDVPDWLRSMDSSRDESPEPQPQEPMMVQPAGDEDVPDWLRSMDSSQDETSEPHSEEPSMAEPAGDDDIPDWLKAMQSEEERAVPQELFQEASQEPVQEEEMIGEESLSDWQIGDEGMEGPVAFDKIDTGELGTSAAEQDDAIAWLEGLAAKHGAKPEELVTDPNARTEVEPEWVQKAKATKEQAGVEEPVSAEPAPVDLPEFLSEKQAEPAIEFETPGSEEELPVEPSADLPAFLAKEQDEGQAEPAAEPAAEVGAVNIDDLGVSAQEQDDAVAWLESLAAKHGAKPEELVTDPNARKETAPEWVQKATEAGSGHAVGERPTAPPPEIFEESVQDVQVEAEQETESSYAELEGEQAEEPLPAANVDETGMWLRDMDEEGGISEEQQPAKEAEVPAMEGDIPDWLREMEADASKTEATPASEVEASLPDWLNEAEAEPSEAESVPSPWSEEEAMAEPAQEVPEKIDVNSASLEQLADLPGIGDMLAQNIIAYREAYGEFSSLDDLSKIAGIGPSTLDDLQDLVEFREIEIETESDEAGITDWLRNVQIEAESPEAEVSEFRPESTGMSAEEDLPSWLAGLDEEVEQTQPAAGSDELPDWLRAEVEEEPAQPEPTTPSDWQAAEVEALSFEEPPAFMPEPEAEEPPTQAVPPPVSEPKREEPPVQAAPAPAPKPEPSAPPAREPYREPVTRSRSGMTGMLSVIQDPALSMAQNELTRGNIPGAMENYSKLIKKGKLLDEIIFDLREALYRYPVEVNILQTLGDAYMRANRLQEALDSYTKAEELLR